MDFLRQWAVGLVVFVVVDLLWIGGVANGFYRRELGPLLRMRGENMDPRVMPAALMYGLLVAGLVLFALPKARPGSLVEAMAWSAFFGLVTYGVYDLTNYSTLQGFSLRMTVVDMAWGATICSLSGAAAWTMQPA